MNPQDSFFQVPHTTHETSAGAVELPIAYYDNSQLVAVFDASAEAARGMLAPAGLTPVLMAGRAQVALVFFEYAHTSIGTFNEVGLAVLARRASARRTLPALLDMLRAPRQRAAGVCIVDLPVTIAAAQAAGCELWGFPKFVTDIPIEWNGRNFRGSVLDPDRSSVICELSGTYRRGLPAPATGLLLYSRLAHTDLRTVVDVRGWGELARTGSLRLSVGNSRHRMAEHLRALGLDGRRPRLLFAAKHAGSLLHRGDPS